MSGEAAKERTSTVRFQKIEIAPAQCINDVLRTHVLTQNDAYHHR